MKASELRLNNWVLQDGLPTQITGYMFHAEFEGLYEIEDEFEPIPLTPEILEAAGLKMVGEKPFFSMRIQLNKTDELCWYSQDKELRYQTIGSGFTRYYKTKFMHQLQNLYFALTGEELEIKL